MLVAFYKKEKGLIRQFCYKNIFKVHLRQQLARVDALALHQCVLKTQEEECQYRVFLARVLSFYLTPLSFK